MKLNEKETRLTELLYAQVTNSLTDQDKRELDELMKLPGVAEFVKKFSDQYIQEQLDLRNKKDIKGAWGRIRLEMGMEPITKEIPVWRKIVIAASFIVVVVTNAYFFNHFRNKKEVSISEVRKEYNDVLPPTGGVPILTLSDGRKIELREDKKAEIITVEDGNKVNKNETGLTYSGAGVAAHESFNTLTTPKGETYRLTLSDGTKVWLNASSSIKFPVAFVKNERQVSVTGEVYFEVAKNTSKPFSVSVNQVNIEVLGTRFNVNAYPTEPSINTTLIDGSVKVRSNFQQSLLKPGEQSATNAEGFIKVMSNVDTDEIIAWQKNEFDFRGRTITEIMRQLKQFYDVNVEFKGEDHGDSYVAKFNRNAPISKVLSILSKTGRVKFKIEEKKIVVIL